MFRLVYSLSERERIWQKVRAVVELRRNVRASQREGRNGEVRCAWDSGNGLGLVVSKALENDGVDESTSLLGPEGQGDNFIEGV